MAARFALLIFLAALVLCMAVSCSGVIAQSDPTQRQMMRLNRPASQNLPEPGDQMYVPPDPGDHMNLQFGSSGQTYSPSSSGSPVYWPGQLDGRSLPTPTLPDNSLFRLGAQQRANSFPNLDVPLQNRERDMPVISVQMLANYNVELIVDQSMSMLTPDCPGPSSRWSWCGMQAQDLATKLAPYVSQGFTITAFAKHYYVHPNSVAQNIPDLFASPALGQGTRLAEPLEDRLGNYFASRRPGSKPLLIAVITDGVPHPSYEPAMVVQTLVKASQNMRSAHEVTVVFLQIGGGDHKGRFFLNDLANNLVNYGARYPVVQVVPFEHLEQVGLAQALVDTIKTFSIASHTERGVGRLPGRQRGL